MLRPEVNQLERACAAVLLGLIAGCGGGGGAATAPAPSASPPPAVSAPVTQFTVGGTVTGLEQGASLTLTNGTEKLSVATNGSFAFPTRLAAGGGFSISASAPSGYSCKVSEGTGVIAGADSARTTVACAPARFAGALSALQQPLAVTADGSGNLYVVDGASYSVVKFTPSGEMSVLAGGTGKPGLVDGVGAQARFRFGRADIIADADGNLLVADGCNGAIRKIAKDGTVSTLAGHGSVSCNMVIPESTGDEIKDGVGTAAAFGFPSKFVSDGAGGVMVIDSVGAASFRKVSAAGVVTSETLSYALIRPVVGVFTAIARTPAGTLYLADSRRIYKVLSGGLVEVAGSPTAGTSIDGTAFRATFQSIRDMVAAPNGDLYVVDGLRIRKVTEDGVVTTLAGDGIAGDAADGQGLAARFSSPLSIALDGNGLVVLDAASSILRRVGFDGAVTTIAVPAPTRGTVDGRGSAARLGVAGSLTADADGNLYFADSVKHVLRKATPDGTVSTIAGQPGVSGDADGPLATATFASPKTVAAGRDGSLWVAQGTRLRRIQNGTVATAYSGIVADALAVDADGNAIVGEWGSGEVVKISPQGQKTVLITNQQIAKLSGGDGWLLPEAVAADAAGNVYVSDTASVAVYKLSKSGELTLFAGTPLKETGDIDGPPGTATLGFYGIGYMALDDSGNLYLSGQGGVRMVNSAGVVSSPTYAWGQTPIGGIAYAKGKLYGMTRFALLQTWLP